MQNLAKYIDSKNQFASIFKQPLITLPVDDKTAQFLFDALDGDLSPENLTCDGELPKAEVNRRNKFYTACVKELKALGFDTVRSYSF